MFIDKFDLKNIKKGDEEIVLKKTAEASANHMRSLLEEGVAVKFLILDLEELKADGWEAFTIRPVMVGEMVAMLALQIFDNPKDRNFLPPDDRYLTTLGTAQEILQNYYMKDILETIADVGNAGWPMDCLIDRLKGWDDNFNGRSRKRGKPKLRLVKK